MHLDEARHVRDQARPRLDPRDGRRAVVDAKYKAEKPAVSRRPTSTSCLRTAPCSG